MKIEIEISDEMISNLLTCAFEGGSNYWLRSTASTIHGDKPPRTEDRTTVPLLDGGLVVCTIQEEHTKGHGVLYSLDRTSIKSGLRVMREKAPRHFGDALAENDDATTGDVFLQCCLFGEVVYG